MSTYAGDEDLAADSEAFGPYLEEDPAEELTLEELAQACPECPHYWPEFCDDHSRVWIRRQLEREARP